MIGIKEYMEQWWEEYPHPTASNHTAAGALMSAGYHGVRIRASFDLVNQRSYSEWCEENIKHGYYYTYPYCFFMDPQDAMLFKLTFG